MVTAEDATLWVHIAAGFLALFAGIGAMATTKGGRQHRRAGRLYVSAMVVVAATAIALFGFDWSRSRGFLALIAVFSFYFVFSGYRALGRKRSEATVGTPDWLGVALVTLASLGILMMGVVFVRAGNGFAPVMLVFGAIGTVVGITDGAAFLGYRDGGTWLGEHVFRMGAGYVATVTAFSTVNFLFLPVVVRWLWPTALGVPATAWAIRHYEAAFGLR
jgi:uncharacterized membrane protein